MSFSRTPYRQVRHHIEPEQEEYGVFPCAPGCRGSARDPRYCVCVCRGINHGCLYWNRPVRPFTVMNGEYASSEPIALPEEPLRLPEIKKPEPVIIERKASVSRKVGRSFFRAMTGYVSADEKNTKILSGLTSQFGPYADTIVTEAFSEYFREETVSPNRPELYELEENGTLDRALAKLGKTWVIGRARLRK